MSAELELAALERQIVAAVAGDFLSAVARLREIAAAGGDVAAFLAHMSAPLVEAALAEAAATAFGLGRDDALAMLKDYPLLAEQTAAAKPSAKALAPLDGLDKSLAAALATSRTLASVGVAGDAAAAPVLAAGNRLAGTVSDTINRAGNEGTTRVADTAGLSTVWVAETDACVTCLAYSGTVARVGGAFPGGLTYGAKSYFPDSIDGPPRHPRCRCTVEPLRDQGYADALRREADRSVLRGFSLESESMSVRIGAAERLIPRLTPGVDVPKSVIAYAQRAVKAGRFPSRGRPA